MILLIFIFAAALTVLLLFAMHASSATLCIVLGLVEVVALLTMSRKISGRSEASARVLSIIAVGIAVRLTLGFLLIWLGLDHVLAPDILAYNSRAQLWVKHWMGNFDILGWDPNQDFAGTFYIQLLGVIYYLAGFEPVYVSLMNSTIAGASIFLAYHIALTIGATSRQALGGALIIALWPSMIVWSCLNLRDSMMHLVTNLAVLSWLKLKQTTDRLSWALALLFAFVAAAEIRWYTCYLLGIAIVAHIFFNALKTKRKLTLLLIPVAAILAVFIDLPSFSKELATLRHTRSQFLGSDVGSAFGSDVVFNSIWDVMLFAPIGVLHVFFAPFPWQIIGSLPQTFAVLEMLMFYGLGAFLIMGIMQKLNSRFSETFFLVTVVLTYAIPMGITEGNVGTIYRHKAQILSYLLIFVPIGWDSWRTKRMLAKNQNCQEMPAI